MTGATGFIGTHLCRALVGLGAEVHAVSRSHGRLTLPGLSWHRVDLTDPKATEACLSRVGAEFVFELCSHAHGERDLALVSATVRGELLSTVNVLSALARIGCARVVLAGSMEEPRPGEAPTSPYAAAKAASRLYVDLFHREFKVPVVMPRIFMTYGPGQSPKKFVAYCVGALLTGETVRVFNPQRRADWIFTHDVVDGLIRTAVAPEVEGRAIDIGTGQLTSLLDLAHLLRELTCSTSEIVVDEVVQTAGEPARVADVVATRKFIGWTASTPLVDGLVQTVRHALGHANGDAIDALPALVKRIEQTKAPANVSPGIARHLNGLLPAFTGPMMVFAQSIC